MHKISTKLLAFVALGLSLCTLPASVSARITLPFSTTYNCAEQDQSSPGWVTCDGISSAGAWTTGSGSKEQITSAANYPGGGGRGQRHWIGDGKNNNSGSVNFSFSGVTEVYTRWYGRWQLGLVMHNGGGQKLQYFLQGTYFSLETGLIKLNHNGTNYDNGGAYTWSDLMGGTGSDGQWHCFESRVKLNSTGQSNGIGQLWIDGVLRLNRTDINFGANPAPIDSFAFPENGYFDTVSAAYQDLDDVAISSTGPIGCLGGTPPPPPPPPPSDTIAPSTPSGVTASAVSSSQINLAWIVSTDNVGVAQYLVEQCSGSSSCTNFGQVGTSTGPSYQMPGLSANTTYRYRVRAQDAAGNVSSYSAMANATTPAGSVLPPPIAGNILFEEKFDDGNFTARGWYDAPNGTISTVEHNPSSLASFECSWVQNGSGCTGGAPMRRKFSATDSVYISFWIKHSSTWTGKGTHLFYFLTNADGDYSGLARNHLTAYVNEGTGGQPFHPDLELQDALNIDETKINIDLTKITENRASQGCNGLLDTTQNFVSCYATGTNQHTNMRNWISPVGFTTTSGPYNMQQWHHLEAYFKLNSIDSNGKAVPNGILRFWLDDNPLFDVSNVTFRTGSHPNMLFNQLILAPYMGTSPANQTIWIDDLTVATAPPASIPPVAAPTNLTLR